MSPKWRVKKEIWVRSAATAEPLYPVSSRLTTALQSGCSLWDWGSVLWTCCSISVHFVGAVPYCRACSKTALITSSFFCSDILHSYRGKSVIWAKPIYCREYWAEPQCWSSGVESKSNVWSGHVKRGGCISPLTGNNNLIRCTVLSCLLTKVWLSHPYRKSGVCVHTW